MDVIEYAERGYMIPSLGVLSGEHDGYEGSWQANLAHVSPRGSHPALL